MQRARDEAEKAMLAEREERIKAEAKADKSILEVARLQKEFD